MCRRVSLLVLLSVAMLAGCAVPQPRGGGRPMRIAEPTTQCPYWLYLPKQYDHESSTPSRTRWPVVVTLHGLKPFDSYRAQIREWQEQADAYGFIVIAPYLKTSVLSLRGHVQSDERAILAVMDHVFSTTKADPTKVLITSWSSGGYMAHYMLNHHPERFSCLAVRQSNFSADILDDRIASRSRQVPVGIFFGENDLPLCASESQNAVRWYHRHNFNVEAYSVAGLGHERTPETAANFFARMCDIEPLDRASAQRALADVRIKPIVVAATTRETAPEQAPASTLATPDRNDRPAQIEPPKPPPPSAPAPLTELPSQQAVLLPRPADTSTQSELALPIRMEISSPGGVAPFYLHFSLDMPDRLKPGLDCLWLHNGEPVCTGLEGRKILRLPGQHRIEAMITMRDGQDLRLRRTVTVRPKLSNTRY